MISEAYIFFELTKNESAKSKIKTRHTNSSLRLVGFELPFCHLLTLWSLPNYLMSVCHSFLTYKMGRTIIPITQGCCDDFYEIIQATYLKLSLCTYKQQWSYCSMIILTHCDTLLMARLTVEKRVSQHHLMEERGSELNMTHKWSLEKYITF